MSRREKDQWASRFTILLMGSVAVAVMGLMLRRAYLDIRVNSPEWKTRFQEEFPGLEEASSLSPERRRLVVQWANAEKCSCRCGYTVASCLKLDSTCPNRPLNLQRLSDRIKEVLNTVLGAGRAGSSDGNNRATSPRHAENIQLLESPICRSKKGRGWILT